MLTFHFKNKEEFYEQIADGSLQKIMMEYFNRSADMGLPVEEDTLFYNFEVEFECVLENGERCITDEEVAHLHGEIAVRLYNVIRSVWRRYQKGVSISEKDFTLTELRNDIWRFIWIDPETQTKKTEYIFLNQRLFVFSDGFCTVFSFPQSISSKDDWSNMTEAEFAGYLTDSSIKGTLWNREAAKDDIRKHYRQRYREAGKAGSIALVEYECYLQHAEEASCREEFLLRIKLDEKLPVLSYPEERWLKTECGLRPDPHITRYLAGLHIDYKKLRHAEPDEEASHY